MYLNLFFMGKIYLDYAGIDTKVFSSHSTQNVSISKAKEKGYSLNEINKADWSHSGTLGKFYNKPILNNLSLAVLNDR